VKILIACEFSGVVREAFRARGHDAWSCDLLPAEDGSEFHYQADAMDVKSWTIGGELRNERSHWDLMIAHPPCTFLANSGVRWLYADDGGLALDRWEKMKSATRFFRELWFNNIERVAVENPIPHRHAELPPYTQTIQPWMFGHGETKATCLWLKNLPKLAPTDVVDGRAPRVHYASPGPNRWKERSRTLTGIAAAMAQQWG
jgi:hypothetical protein